MKFIFAAAVCFALVSALFFLYGCTDKDIDDAIAQDILSGKGNITLGGDSGETGSYQPGATDNGQQGLDSASNPAYCDSLKAGQAKDDCYMYEASSKNDSYYCHEMGNPDQRVNCFVTVAKANRNTYACTQIFEADISKSKEKDQCMAEVALLTQDASDCNGIAGVVTQDNCYTDIAKAMNNVSACRNIKDAEGAYYCSYNVGVHIKDPTGCEWVNDNALMLKCIHNIAVAARNLGMSNPCVNLKSDANLNECNAAFRQGIWEN